MRLFLASDLHVDYPENLHWIESVSEIDYVDDVLLLAGDISDEMHLIERVLRVVKARFRHVVFIPGNHDLWTSRSGKGPSFGKFDAILSLCREEGIETGPLAIGKALIVPLLAWYDYSFGQPGPTIRRGWMDFYKCNWEGLQPAEVAFRFEAMNVIPDTSGFDAVYSASHFVPRIDLMPARYPEKHKALFPVLGTDRLETQIRRLGSQKHFYGHSHLNRNKVIDGVTYINNAYGYPSETEISAKTILHVADL
ncbi:metallophosphoesterase [Rhizobium wuzhouense]|uniref:Calcineurin-like phosphoesterase domain-containing protein n=1 Tax=Rhizobium wuzhouense TaxID=1986026 RepID=A0ABX5NT32_9HYPH|nr:metallophosphoesterase [Rhizobium wuzhouense]PYB75071.1 hypothetical protein DMY87_06260 [Rhizobium wuzhouense]